MTYGRLILVPKNEFAYQILMAFHMLLERNWLKHENLTKAAGLWNEVKDTWHMADWH